MSSFLIIYLWINTIFIFLIENPWPYILGIALTSGMDLWRHTGFQNEKLISFYHFLSLFFITPSQHQWHHSLDKRDVNFGANWSLWDRIHGTWWYSKSMPQSWGLSENISLLREFIWPRRIP